MKVNILYLTNQCNLKCPYCYEQQGQIERDKKVISNEEIDDTLHEIVTNEPINVSTLCLMGGEPLLEFEKIKYVVEKCKEIKQNKKKSIALNIISNGTLIHKHIKDIKEMLTSSDVYMSLDVSYDGINQHLRTNQSNIVQNNLKLLKENSVPFGVSYTITGNNCNKSVLLRDLVEILERYYPNKDENLVSNDKKKIRLNLARKEIEESTNSIFNEQAFKNSFKYEFEYLFDKYHIPMCDFICKVCKRCNKTLFNGKSYYMHNSDVVIEPMQTIKPFNHF